MGGLAVVLAAPCTTGTPLTFDDGFDDVTRPRWCRSGGEAAHVSLVADCARENGRRPPSGRHGAEIAPPPAELPDNCVVTYGMTETGSGVVYDGRPLDGVEVRAVDGELELRGPMLLRAYRDGSSPLDADGWLATGDAGSVADDGTVSVMGRIGDVVVTGGEKVWPEAVEPVLAAVAGVAEVGVAGRPDPEWGQRVVAWVVRPRRPGDATTSIPAGSARPAVKAALLKEPCRGSIARTGPGTECSSCVELAGSPAEARPGQARFLRRGADADDGLLTSLIPSPRSRHCAVQASSSCSLGAAHPLSLGR